jgi:ketosteroid isomerase-like protein
MRTLQRVVVVVMSILLCPPLRAQSQEINRAKRQIAALEEAWITAVIRRDAAAFDRLLAPAFVYTDDDRVYTKAQLITEVTTGSDTVTSGRNEDLVVRVHGNTAIATGWLVLIGHGARGPFERRYRYTDTWQRAGAAGRWWVIAAQDYLKP